MCVCAENIFKVTVHKTAQGLGLSVTGGVAPSIPVVDNCSWPGLIRIKKIFVHGAAWQTEKLAVGDVLLAVNGVPLTGSTNYVSFPKKILISFFFRLIYSFRFIMKRAVEFTVRIGSVMNKSWNAFSTVLGRCCNSNWFQKTVRVVEIWVVGRGKRERKRELLASRFQVATWNKWIENTAILRGGISIPNIELFNVDCEHNALGSSIFPYFLLFRLFEFCCCSTEYL